MQSTQVEQWRPILRYEGYYEISDQGRVRSLRSGIILSSASLRRGYRSVTLAVDGRREQRSIHHMVGESFLTGTGEVLRHLDGNKSNNAATNLAYGTHAENAQDTIRHGHNPRLNRTRCVRGHDLTAIAPDRLGHRVCRACRAAVRAALLERIQSGELPHATVAAYTYGCRCGECVAFNSNYLKERREARKERQSA